MSTTEPKLRYGFTAIEVLAATTLAAMLMVAVLGVLAGISKKQKSLVANTRVPPQWHDGVVKAIRTDLRSAQSLTFSNGTLQLQAGTDSFATLTSWQPTQISYSVVNEGSYSLLLRTAQGPGAASTNTTTMLVCVGVDEILLCDLNTKPESGLQIKTLPDGAIPPRLRLVLTVRGDPILNRIIHVY